MWIQVRTMDGKRSVQIDELSKLTLIEELKAKIEEHFEISRPRQRLFFSGKQVTFQGLLTFRFCVSSIKGLAGMGQA